MAKDQLTVLYEESGLKPESIAAQLGLSVETVETQLARTSTKFRADLAARATEDVSDKELKALYARVKQLAMQDEDPRLALTAATWLIDDKKGRKDKAAGTVINNTTNVFNKVTQNMNAAAERRIREITSA